MALLPKVKLKAVVSFPATILDGVGVDTVRQNGAYQFNLAYDDFAPPVALVPDPPHQNALLWNSVTGVYSLVPISIIATGGAVPEAPNDGTIYGRQSTTWVPAWNNPVFTGDPKAPTPAPGDNDTSVATTAFVNGAIAATIVPSNVNPAMDGVAAPGVSALYSRGDHVHPVDTSRAPLASPIFTGDPRAPTPAPGDNDTSIATTQFVTASFAPLASPTFTGDPKAPTPSAGDNDTSIATTQFVMTAVGGFVTDAPNDGTQYGRQFQSGAMTWTPVVGGTGGGGGDVSGPTGAVADHIATFNGTTGKVIKDGGVPISTFANAPAALTRANDTNVTLTLTGAPNTALLQATLITVGWNGTLQASRGGFGADVSAANGVPLFAAGVPTFTGTTGTGNFARVNSPVFTGDPQAPTPTAGDNDTSIATTAFVTAAIGTVPQSCGFLSFATPNIILRPFFGNLLTINGVNATIPDAGVTLAPTGLTVGTLYYIYATQSGGAVNALEASTTAYAISTTAGSQGLMCKSGDVTRRLVGLVRPIAGPAFSDLPAQRFVRSWLNRERLQLQGAPVTGSTTSTSAVEISTASRVEFLLWAAEVADMSCTGTAYNGTAGQSCYSTIAFDGVSEAVSAGANSAQINYDYSHGVRVVKLGLTEGYHYSTVFGRVSGGTGTWYGGSSFTLYGMLK